MRISVTLWFSTPNMPPYTETSGTMSTWNGMTIEATIAAKKMEHAFHAGLRTITYAAIADTSTVSTVAQTVMTAELANTVQKFIFSMASGKLSRVKPRLPIRASGAVLMSAFFLKTLMTTSRNGRMNASSAADSRANTMAWMALVRMLFWLVITPPPRPSCRCTPAARR